MKRQSILVTLCVCLISVISFASGAKAPEWTYSYALEDLSITISSSPCYENDEKAQISMRLYGTIRDATVSADASCDCGEAMIIDDGKPITPQSFAKLVSDALSTQLKNYRCEPITE